VKRVPIYLLPVPIYLLAVPIYLLAVPIYKLAVPIYKLAVPIYLLTVPIYRLAVPIYPLAVPIYPLSVPISVSGNLRRSHEPRAIRMKVVLREQLTAKGEQQPEDRRWSTDHRSVIDRSGIGSR
jgi:hypothetical protein